MKVGGFRIEVPISEDEEHEPRTIFHVEQSMFPRCIAEISSAPVTYLCLEKCYRSVVDFLGVLILVTKCSLRMY